MQQFRHVLGAFALMWHGRILRLLTVMALAVAGSGAGGSVGHAATTTASHENYNYDQPAEFAQRAFSGMLCQTGYVALRSVHRT